MKLFHAFHSQQPTTRDIDRFWDLQKDTVRRQLEEKATQIGAPDFDSLFRHPVAAVIPKKRWSFLLPLALPGAVAAGLLVFAFPQASRPLAHEMPQTFVVDQVFLSTSSGDSLGQTGGGRPNSAAFSSVLRTIDTGLSHWDDALMLEE